MFLFSKIFQLTILYKTIISNLSLVCWNGKLITSNELTPDPWRSDKVTIKPCIATFQFSLFIDPETAEEYVVRRDECVNVLPGILRKVQ